MKERKQQPYATFGDALKKLRQKTKETELEVSGAVEIDNNALQSYETGEARPTEDILMLLIQHFDLSNEGAAELWRLAGYGMIPTTDSSHYFMNEDPTSGSQPQTMNVVQDDAKVVYTDMVQVMVNNYGVIVNFMQGAGVSGGPLAVSRIGMSKEHAQSVIDVLRTTLDQAETIDRKRAQTSKAAPKQLPPGTKKRDN